VLKLANKGYRQALKESPALLNGLNVVDVQNDFLPGGGLAVGRGGKRLIATPLADIRHHATASPLHELARQVDLAQAAYAPGAAGSKPEE